MPACRNFLFFIYFFLTNTRRMWVTFSFFLSEGFQKNWAKKFHELCFTGGPKIRRQTHFLGRLAKFRGVWTKIVAITT